MIKLFRHIRKSLLEQNKMGKYFTYAIGEIILVVIGILIALQINNWNEQNKARNYELIMLEELDKAMSSDIKNLDNIIPYLERVRNSYATLTKYKNGTTFSKDSVKKVVSQIKNYGYLYTTNKGPYQSINSMGLDRISNIEIRNTIAELYDSYIPDATSWINEVLRVEIYNKNEVIHELFEGNSIVGKNNYVITELDLSNIDRVKSSKEMEELLRTSWPLYGSLLRLNTVKNKMTALKKLIEQEFAE